MVEIECLNAENDTVIGRCWEPTSLTARAEWYKVKNTIEIPSQELFHIPEATRVDPIRQRSHLTRCHFKDDRITPRPQLGLFEDISQPKSLQMALDCCRSQPTDYIVRINTDGSCDVPQLDVHSIFDANAVRHYASASVVLLPDGLD